MKLTLKISAAIILLLLISVYGYLQFRESSSYRQQLAKNASVVYKLNIDGLLKTIASDFIGNPGYYLKNNKNERRRPDFSFPANIFVYSLETRSPSTIFSSFTLSDTTGLNAFLKQALKIEHFVSTIEKRKENEPEAGKTVGTSADHKITVVYNGTTLAIAYSFKREAVMEELNDILAQRNRLEDQAPLMIALKKAKGHLSWTTTAYSGQVNFNDGEAEVEGSFPTEGWIIPDHPGLSVKFAENALVKIWLNAKPNLAFTAKSAAISEMSETKKESGMPKVPGKPGPVTAFKEWSINGLSLSSDSLLKSYLGFASLEIGPGIPQVDSLITYEYNDDFEKVAAVQLKKVMVPHLKLSIKAKTRDLLNYLKTNQVLDIDNRLNKHLFPLYQVFSSQNDHIWQLSTLKNDLAKPVSVSNSDFFSAEMDLKEIKAQQLFPLVNNWIKPYTHLNITAAKLDNGTAKLTGTLKFQHESINAFIQMIR